MTAAENIAIAPRAGKLLTFTRKRGNATAEFFPGAGSTLHFANRDTDLFTARGLPAGLLQAGDKVEVYYGATQPTRVRVFAGDVKTIVDRHGSFAERVQDVTVAGPWDRLNRLVFRQTWGAGNLAISSSRVILGQTAEGLPQTMAAQLDEIVGFAADPCGIEAGNNGAPAQYLPLDEARDITCADAIRRELRFFPKLVVRFDYSSATPALVIDAPSATDAAYVASIPKTDREYTYDAHPVSCVDVTVDAVDIAINGDDLSFHQKYPEDGDTDDLDCLHVTVPLARGGGSVTSETFKIESEEIPGALDNVHWWATKHPRLANLAEKAIKFASNPTRSPSNYGYIVKNAREEIEAAGKHCEVSRFTCKVKIETPDDIEDEVTLTMDFLTTDARSGTYTVQTGSTATAGEELPAGLAQALYEQRSQSLASERMTVRLGATFPTLGDAADGLILQSFDVDLADLTARLSFGRPEHLSAEDMRSLLNGFRQRGSASTAVLREREGSDAEDQPAAPGGIPPISSSEWSPGTKQKTTITGGTGAGSIVLDATKVDDGKTIDAAKIRYTDSEGNEKEVQVLGTEDIDFSDLVDIEADPDRYVEVDDKTIYASVRQDEETGTTLIGLTEQAPDDEDDEDGGEGDEGYCNNISDDAAKGGNGISVSGIGGSGSDSDPEDHENDISNWPCKKNDDAGGNDL